MLWRKAEGFSHIKNGAGKEKLGHRHVHRFPNFVTRITPSYVVQVSGLCLCVRPWFQFACKKVRCSARSGHRKSNHSPCNLHHLGVTWTDPGVMPTKKAAERMRLEGRKNGTEDKPAGGEMSIREHGM